MRKFIFFALVLTTFFACKDEQRKTVYQPSVVESQTKRPSFKPNVEAKPETVKLDQDHILKMSIWIPKENSNFDTSCQEHLVGKLTSLVGTSMFDANQCFVLATSLSKITENLTASVPQCFHVKYRLNFSVVNILTKDIYASYSTIVNGVGTSKISAQINAIENFSNYEELRDLLIKSYNTAVKKYETDASKFKNTVESYISTGEYEKAASLLDNIPQDAHVCKQYALSKQEVVRKLYTEKKEKDILLDMKSAIASSPTSYDATVGALCKIIPVNSPTRKEAEHLLDNYIKSLSEIERSEINHKMYIEKESLKIRELELSSKIESEKRMALALEEKETKQTNSNGDGDFWSGFFKTMTSALSTNIAGKLVGLMFPL